VRASLFLRRHRVAIGILLVAWVLRLGIVFRGGQGNSSDEFRYNFALLAADHVSRGELSRAVGAVWSSYGHVGFTVLMLPVALFECLIAPELPHGPLEEQELKLPAVFLSTASVACVGAVYALALSLGGPPSEAVIAALLAAASNCLFYWARSIVPYDAAMAFELVGLLVALGRGRELLRSFVAGALISFGIFVYYGSWYAAASTLVGALLIRSRERSLGLVFRGGALFLGGAIFPCALTCMARAASAPGSLLERMRAFSETITHGAYEEGWRLPWEYLWHAEHALLLVWVLGATGVLILTLREGAGLHRRGLVALGLALGTYASLVLASTVLHRFVVYGRLARQLAPFLCLAAAHAAWCVGARWPSRLGAVASGLALAANTALSFAPVFAQRFPVEVRREVARERGPFDEEFTLEGSIVLIQGTVPELHRGSRWVLVNARPLFAIRGIREDPSGRVVFETPHPLAWPPAIFEGYSPEERAILRRAPPMIRLLDRGHRPG
jgi:hypothetical protein